MNKKNKVLTLLLVSLFFLLFLFSIIFTQRKFQKLDEKIKNLETLISQKNNGQLSRNEGDLGNIRLGEDRDLFEKMEQKVEDFFNSREDGRLEELFPNEEEINNIETNNNPNTDIRQTVQFSNTTIINGTKFSYTFSVSDGELNGVVTSNNLNKLQELKNSLKKLKVSIISSDDKQFEFETDKEMTVKVLQLFNIKMK